MTIEKTAEAKQVIHTQNELWRWISASKKVYQDSSIKQFIRSTKLLKDNHSPHRKLRILHCFPCMQPRCLKDRLEDETSALHNPCLGGSEVWLNDETIHLIHRAYLFKVPAEFIVCSCCLETWFQLEGKSDSSEAVWQLPWIDCFNSPKWRNSLQVPTTPSLWYIQRSATYACPLPNIQFSDQNYGEILVSKNTSSYGDGVLRSCLESLRSWTICWRDYLRPNMRKHRNSSVSHSYISETMSQITLTRDLKSQSRYNWHLARFYLSAHTQIRSKKSKVIGCTTVE